MKIVFGTSAFYPYFDSGGAVYTFNVARWLARFGHDVTVLCDKKPLYSNKVDPQLPNYEEFDGIKIVRASRSYRHGATITSLPSLFGHYSELKRMVRGGDVDIVNPVTYRSFLPFLTATKGKVPCVPTIHAILLRDGVLGLGGWWNFTSRKLSALAGCLVENIVLHLPYDGLIAVSDWLAEDLSRYYPQKRIEVVYGGVDLEEIDKVRSEPKDPAQVAFLGSLIQHKNILDAIEAMRLAKKEMKDLKLLIMSNGGEYEGVVERICREDPSFRYYKGLSRGDIFRILKQSSLFLYPSEETSFSLVVAESLACHTPFIAYDLPTIRMLKQLMPGGVLVPHRNLRAFSEKICELLTNKARLEKLAAIGRKAVENNFTWEKTARRTEQVFGDFLNQYRGQS